MDNTFQSAHRVLQLLQCFSAERRELRVRDFAAGLGVHRSTACRVAATLVERGFLERVPGRRAFRLGPQMWQLGLLALQSRDLLSLAQPTMERLAEETGETVNLATRDGDGVINLLQIDGRHAVGAGAWTGRRTEMHCVANGKVLLAFGEGNVDIAPGRLKRYTAHTVTSTAHLRAVLDDVRRKGWATNVGEMDEYITGIAAPVFDGSRRCQAAISVYGPSYRLSPKQFPRLGRMCVVAGREISQQLRG